jgi:hypothetical protein
MNFDLEDLKALISSGISFLVSSIRDKMLQHIFHQLVTEELRKQEPK